MEHSEIRVMVMRGWLTDFALRLPIGWLIQDSDWLASRAPIGCDVFSKILCFCDKLID